MRAPHQSLRPFDDEINPKIHISRITAWGWPRHWLRPMSHNRVLGFTMSHNRVLQFNTQLQLRIPASCKCRGDGSGNRVPTNIGKTRIELQAPSFNISQSDCCRLLGSELAEGSSLSVRQKFLKTYFLDQLVAFFSKDILNIENLSPFPFFHVLSHNIHYNLNLRFSYMSAIPYLKTLGTNSFHKIQNVRFQIGSL